MQIHSSISAQRNQRMAIRIRASEPRLRILPGSRVAILVAEGAYLGIVHYRTPVDNGDNWYGVVIDGETAINEWPASIVWAL